MENTKISNDFVSILKEQNGGECAVFTSGDGEEDSLCSTIVLEIQLTCMILVSPFFLKG